MRRLLVVVWVVVWVAVWLVGCGEDPVAVVACTQDEMCPSATPACDREAGVCVECTGPATCDSAMCRPTGVCVREQEALFVGLGSDGDCTREAPCDLATALSRIDAQHDAIAVTGGGLFTLAETVVVTRSLSLFWIPPGGTATITAFDIPVAFDVGPDASIAMFGLGFGANTGIRCDGGTVDVIGGNVIDQMIAIEANACNVRVRETFFVRTYDRAIVATGGHVDVARSYFTDMFNAAIKATTGRIVASAFHNNGNAETEVSAIELEAGEITSVTIDGGLANPTTGYAVRCGTARVRNSIVFRNSNLAPFADCDVTYTNSQPAQPGVGNFEADPVLASNGIHIGPDSPCIGAGDPELAGQLDYDGEVRDGVTDCGADEVF